MNTVRKILSGILKKLSYGEHIRPARDWFVLISIAGIVFVLSIAGNILLFRNFEYAKVPSGQIASTTPQSIGDSISQIQQVFQARAAEETNYQQTYHFVDPSLPGS